MLPATSSELTPGTAPHAPHDDWDRHWEEYTAAAEANPAQRYRRRLVLRLLERAGSAPRRLIDLGSGQGDLLAAAHQRWPGAELVGIEPSEQGVRHTATKVPAARLLTLDLTAAAPPPDLAGWAGHMACSEVLEHVEDPVALLSAARPLLEPGGTLAVTVPGGRMSAFDREIGHRQHFTPDALAAVLRDAGYSVDWCSGAGFPFFNLYRAVVVARGEKLAGDVAAAGRGRPSLAARAAMAGFRPLFHLTLTRSPFGTQIVGVARRPAEG